jgi:hypothetical protein
VRAEGERIAHHLTRVRACECANCVLRADRAFNYMWVSQGYRTRYGQACSGVLVMRGQDFFAIDEKSKDRITGIVSRDMAAALRADEPGGCALSVQ